ncbi:MAG: beta-mannosidase [Chitinophagaceae bacterium]|nr:beta-mannosidase [Chitinophagaceae bacterium]
MTKNNILKRFSAGRILAILIYMLLLGNTSCKKSGDEASIPEVDEGSNKPDLKTIRAGLADVNATDQTTSLFYIMKQLSKTKIMFGHQDATKRGVGWANEESKPYQPERSDVKEVSGAYPSVYGWDFNFIAGNATGAWFNYENKVSHDLTVDAYNRGGINTYCWHYDNPVSNGSFYWDESPVEAVSKILPGGTHNDVFKRDLKKIADFSKTLIGADGKLVPVIFRPFHEFDGNWFWWGQSHCTAEEYKKLYQFTVSYLRDTLQVHNFLYAWSPDKNFNSQAQYLLRYPGDTYVDLVGMDNYGDFSANGDLSAASAKLKIVSDYAISKNKIAALTETGLPKLTQTNWYTQSLLTALRKQPVQLAYVLVWANRDDTYWTPYKGHVSSSDFITFKDNGYLVFGDKIPEMYRLQ